MLVLKSWFVLKKSPIINQYFCLVQEQMHYIKGKRERMWMKAGKVAGEEGPDGGRRIKRQLQWEEDERTKRRDVDRVAFAHRHTSGKRLQLARHHALVLLYLEVIHFPSVLCDNVSWFKLCRFQIYAYKKQLSMGAHEFDTNLNSPVSSFPISFLLILSFFFSISFS